MGVAEEGGVGGCGDGDEILAVGVVWARGEWWKGAWEAEICGCSGGREEGLDGAEQCWGRGWCRSWSWSWDGVGGHRG